MAGGWEGVGGVGVRNDWNLWHERQLDDMRGYEVHATARLSVDTQNTLYLEPLNRYWWLFSIFHFSIFFQLPRLLPNGLVNGLNDQITCWLLLITDQHGNTPAVGYICSLFVDSYPSSMFRVYPRNKPGPRGELTDFFIPHSFSAVTPEGMKTQPVQC